MIGRITNKKKMNNKKNRNVKMVASDFIHLFKEYC